MTQKLASVEDIEAALEARKSNRLVNWFTLPASLGETVGFTRIGLVELSGNEMALATRRGNLDQVQTAFELAKESIRYAGDQRLTTADGSADEFWANTGPGFSQVRQLAMAAYAKIHTPDRKDTEAFLASQEISTR